MPPWCRTIPTALYVEPKLPLLPLVLPPSKLPLLTPKWFCYAMRGGKLPQLALSALLYHSLHFSCQPHSWPISGANSWRPLPREERIEQALLPTLLDTPQRASMLVSYHHIAQLLPCAATCCHYCGTAYHCPSFLNPIFLKQPFLFPQKKGKGSIGVREKRGLIPVFDVLGESA